MASLASYLNLAIVAKVLASLAVVYLIVGALVNYFKLRQFKGPPLAGFSRLWLFWQAINARVNQSQVDAIRKYGSVCRIGPDLLVTDDVDIIRHMSSPRSRWRRSAWYTANRFDPRFDTVFSTRDEKVHADLKAKEAGGYNGRNIDTLEPDIDARVVEMIHLIKDTYDGRVMDVVNLTRFFTLDVLSTIAFGKKFGFMAANEDLWDYNKTLSGFFLIFELAGNHPFFRYLLSRPWLFAIVGPKETDKVGMGPMLAFARAAVAERFGSDPKVKQDMLGHFVEKGLDQLRCEVEANLQIIAGSDSTTTVLRCILYLLAGSPVAYNKLRAEIDSAVSTAIDSEVVITYTDSQKLPYLQACIWETLRMYPPLFGLKSKISPPGGETIKGIHFPEGVEVAMCDDAMCKREDIFGPDAQVFRPDRWIEANAEARTQFERTVDAVFGSGRFYCLGRHIAMMELNKAVIELIRRFDWTIVDPIKAIPASAHGVHIQSNMNMVARSRNL